MKIITLRRFRYWVVNVIASNPSSAKSFLIRGWIFLTLLLMIVPRPVASEIAYGSSADKPDLKSALRSMLWLWNRSWIPVKHTLVKYFNIGWILSEESCQALVRRGFLSHDPLKKTCDLAQYKLSAIRAGVQSDEQLKVTQADGEILSLVSSVFERAYRWVAAVKDAKVRPEEGSPKKSHDVSDYKKSFDNHSTRAALLDFDDLCAAIGQEYFLVSGTFLGVVRDRAFIGHDHDIDLGVLEDALLDTLIPALQASKNFVVTKVDRVCLRQVEAGRVHYRNMAQPAIMKILHRSGIAMDVFVHFYDGDLVWHGSSVHRWDNKSFELKDYEFLGRSFKGPKNFDLYLCENYGADWRVPKTDFDTDLDTPNMSFIGTSNSLAFWAWMVALAVAERRPERVRAYLRLLEAAGIFEIRDGEIWV